MCNVALLRGAIFVVDVHKILIWFMDTSNKESGVLYALIGRASLCLCVSCSEFQHILFKDKDKGFDYQTERVPFPYLKLTGKYEWSYSNRE